ncbi:hypothetical protein JCM19046_3526 [Bacillus sp. JCM 19046]|nr:hypothetical protein JCM19045_4249 [Bacillus sp. JCM 19045]GAF18914.1 hypothetical protein JCM19046_3526 [Bacillus sp. JCM 19046]
MKRNVFFAALAILFVGLFSLLIPTQAHAEEGNEQEYEIMNGKKNAQLQHTSNGSGIGIGRVVATGGTIAAISIEYHSGKSPVQWTKDKITNIELEIRRQTAALYKQLIDKYIIYNYVTNRVSWGCIPGNTCLAPTSGDINSLQ